MGGVGLFFERGVQHLRRTPVTTPPPREVQKTLKFAF